jgi:hypothetical protein
MPALNGMFKSKNTKEKNPNKEQSATIDNSCNKYKEDIIAYRNQHRGRHNGFAEEHANPEMSKQGNDKK